MYRIFLSTLSLRRATACPKKIGRLLVDFYPRSPCGERLGQLQCILGGKYFYPRSPCGERLYYSDLSRFWNDFYPRSPCGERQ